MKLVPNCTLALALAIAGAGLPGCSSRSVPPDTSAGSGQPPAKGGGATTANAKAAKGQAPAKSDNDQKGKTASKTAAQGKAESAAPPIDAAEALSSIVAGFQSPYSVEVFAAAETFRQLPADIRRNVLAQLSADERASVRHNAWRSFATFATRDDVPTLKAALDSPHEEVRISALELLAQFPNDDTIDVLTRALQDPALRERAEPLLARVGPAAEGAVLDYANHSDALLRQAAWRVLGQIGSRRSLLSLEQLASMPAYQQDGQLQAALAEIRARLRR